MKAISEKEASPFTSVNQSKVKEEVGRVGYGETSVFESIGEGDQQRGRETHRMSFCRIKRTDLQKEGKGE